jgi:hypothetical protein
MDGTQLEVIVCDECLKARWQRVALVHPRQAADRMPWDEYAPYQATRSKDDGRD